MRFLNNIKSLLCITVLIPVLTSQAMQQVAESNVFAPNRLGRISIFHDEAGFLCPQ